MHDTPKLEASSPYLGLKCMGRPICQPWASFLLYRERVREKEEGEEEKEEEGTMVRPKVVQTDKGSMTKG